MSIEVNHKIALAKTSTLSRTTWGNRNHQNRAGNRQLIIPNHATMQRNILATYTKVTSPDLPFFNEPPGHVFGCVYADSKANALRRENDRRVNTDHLATRVD